MRGNPPSFPQVQKFMELFEQRKMGFDEIQRFMSSGFFTDLLDADLSRVNRRDFRRLLFLGSEAPTFELEVDYTISVPELIELGNYDKVDERFRSGDFKHADQMWGGKAYCTEGQSTLTIWLMPVHVDLQHRYAAGWAWDRGGRTLEPRELLTLGYKYPELQLKNRICSPKDVGCDPTRKKWPPYVTPCLGCTPGGKRTLGLRSIDTPYDWGHVFAVTDHQ